ncbi:hypothetical protein GR7B_00009 [Vibrio phage vB_VcorM_GR7B]|nr:hypothetical protein GR7B_00009 [Vibrio phage vB_VcorM_GR7B]
MKNIGNTRNGDIHPETAKGLLDYLLPHAYRQGTTRRVFDVNGGDYTFSFGSTVADKELWGQPKVVKVACRYESGQILGIMNNIREWEVWSDVRTNPELARWFCPVVEISDCGRYLMMVKCQPAKIEDIPQQIPSFLKDVHLDNWGVLHWEGKTRVVMIDYGHMQAKLIPDSWEMENYHNVIDEETIG